MLDAHCFLDQSTWKTGFIFPSRGHSLMAVFKSPFLIVLKIIEELLCYSLFSRGPPASLPQKLPSTVKSSSLPAFHGHRRILFYFSVKTSNEMYKGALKQLREGGRRAVLRAAWLLGALTIAHA